MGYLTPSTAASFDVTLPADGSPVSVTIDLGTGNNRFLRVAVGFRNNNNHTIDGITIAGDALTAFGVAVVATQCFQQMFYRAVTATGEQTLEINPSTGLGATAAIVSFLVSDAVDVSGTPFDGYVTANGTDTTADVTVASEAGDEPFVMYTVRAATPTASAPTNYTERYENVNGNLMSSGGEGVGAASVAFTGTVTSSGVNAWVAMGANLNAAVGGAVSMTATVAAFTETGLATGLTVQRKFAADVAAFLFTGNPVALIYDTAIEHFTITAVVGSFGPNNSTLVFRGIDATLRYNYNAGTLLQRTTLQRTCAAIA